MDRYDNKYPSVTQILCVLRKIGLEYWFKYNTAQFCDEESKRGIEVGTQIHEAIETHIRGKKVKVNITKTHQTVAGKMLFAQKVNSNHNHRKPKSNNK